MTERYHTSIKVVFVTILMVFLTVASGFSYPVQILDSTGKKIVIKKRPERVVSLVPSVTEVIFEIGAGDSVAGVTYHSTSLSGAVLKRSVGGYFSPSVEAIEEIGPDVIFISDLHKEVMEKFGPDSPYGKSCLLINLNARSVEGAFRVMGELGKIFEKNREAGELIGKNLQKLDIIAEKVAKIPPSKRKRVMRLMGRDKVMIPGDDSFQNEFIALAGGIPPETGKKGDVVSISREAWKAFNPQVIYGCGGDGEVAERLFDKPGWRDVDAVRNGKICYFPCDLTCRASTNIAYFVSWLAARIYPDEFSVKEEQVLKERVVESDLVKIDLPYVKDARVDSSYIHDFINQTLVIDFKKPLAVVSTLEGHRKGIETVGNHYSPPPTWALGHSMGLEGLRERIYGVFGKDEQKTSFLFTGARMENLAVKVSRFKEMTVYALVTAGVRGNAQRMSKDNGGYYEPGTINIIVMTNMRLSQRAMTRAIIAATEAKTAALNDMDIRSSYLSRRYRATGTGTDNVLVVEGEGFPIDNAGGHSKMGELISKAVYAGVREAIFKQNGIVGNRNVFQRLRDRKMTVSSLVKAEGCDCGVERSAFAAEVEKILLDSRYGSFIEAAFALSDDYENGLIHDISFFNEWCRRMAGEITGKEMGEMRDLTEGLELPQVVKTALNALLNGALERVKS